MARARLAALCCVLAGCAADGESITSLTGGPAEPGLTGADGGVTGSVDPAQGGPEPPGGAGSGCAEEARWVYVVHSDQQGQNSQLLRFEPDTLRFTPVGRLDCAAASNDPFADLLGATPFSMAIDRAGTAWVLYSDGNLYHVSTHDASCAPSGFTPQQTIFSTFGMGFVSDTPGGAAETLFVASAGGSAMLGVLDRTTLTIQPRGTVGGSPELTGTGNAQLWGFFPKSAPASVRQLDKQDGSALQSFSLGFSTAPRAWAFAFWGGRFYVFIQGENDPSTHVWRLDPTSGLSERVITSSGWSIVGAGVSTCAPVSVI